MASNVLEIAGITKSFPGVKALENVSLSIKKGSVHALCGENGAGKSTLMKIINGLHQADAGKILVKGEPVHIKSPFQAREYGIAMIFQELNYIPEMSIEENFYLGEWPSRFKSIFRNIRWKELRKNIGALLQNEKLPYLPTTKIKYLSISEIQHLEILKAVSKNAEIIIMDEPSSAITEREVALLFEKIAQLKKLGTSILYISHKMDEIFQIADDITVLRDGRAIETRIKEDFTINEVISLMVGRTISENYPPKYSSHSGNSLESNEKSPQIAIQVENLCRENVLHNISFHGYKGEIVGFSGLMGAGRTELMRALFGLDNFGFGTIQIHGKNCRIRKVSDSISYGMAMLTEDRKRYGIIPMRSIRENTTLTTLYNFYSKGFLHKKKEFLGTQDICQKLNLNTNDYEKMICTLSGGNQQKVILARLLLLDPEILIMDEPTRGIDVGAKYEIYKIIRHLAAQGKTIIFISSELPELMGMSDRIYVMSGGKIRGELTRKEFSQEKILQLAVL